MSRLEKIVDQLAGKKVLFLGQTRTMSEEDIALFLDQIGAKRAQSMEDEGIGLVVLGRLLNPVEEAWSDEREKEGVPAVPLGELERYYAASIDPETLLGSLALFANQERILNLLHNKALPDDLFCDLLRHYDWEGLGPFESDENRDVAGSIVARFYPEIEKNHNIQYSPVGPFLVAASSDNAKLLSAMSEIPDYEITQRSRDAWMPRSLHESLLINPRLPIEVLERFLASKDLRKEGFAAAHPNLPDAWQKKLMERSEGWILEGLARNPNLSPKLHEELLRSENPAVRRAFLQSQRLDDATIEEAMQGDEGDRWALGSNESLTEDQAMRLAQSGDEVLQKALAANASLGLELYEALEATKRPEVLRALAANPAVAPEILGRLTRMRDKTLYLNLAANPATPVSHLRNFAKIKDKDIAKALASNPSTPIEILLGYQMDSELNQILRRNEAFGEYIKQNLGM